MAEVFGKYEILARLATGGMAEILLARQRGIMGFEKLVVIKKILPHLAHEQRFMLMFFDEARIAARLNHPNVVQVYELGQVGEEYFISMEYLEGQSLATVMRQAHKLEMPLSPEIVTAIGVQICAGLGYAHELRDAQGEPVHLVHRDLSPQNIFVLYSGTTKVVDFGIARAEKKLDKTRTGIIKGKYAYMSPEQAQGAELDARSDLFSLGTVLWECLSLRRLFKRSNELATAQAILFSEIPPPSELRPEVPARLDAIVLKALARDPDDRYSSAREIQQDLLAMSAELGYQTGSTRVATAMQALFSDTISRHQEIISHASKDGSVSEAAARDLRPQTDESLTFDGTAKSELPMSFAPALGRKRGSRLPWFLLSGLLVLIGAAAVWLLAFDGLLLLRPVQDGSPGPAAGPPAADAGSRDAGRTDAGRGPGPGGADEPASEAPDGLTAEPVDGPPADQDRTAAAPRPTWGRVRIVTEPAGARIWVDGKALAQRAPIRALRLKSGLHEVEAELDGHRKTAGKVRVRRGRQSSLRLVLPTIDQPGKPEPPPKAEAVGFGFLRLDSDPWTEVYLGEKKLGPTPLFKVELPAGTHRLRLVNEEAHIDRRVEIRIRKGELTKRSIRF
ncbi:MAG: serine/threonine protein kinase [Deltaproteobacteria bacterium]|nr:serine/threonine protein kinase [Deltaproteobacteria bacterium]